MDQTAHDKTQTVLVTDAGSLLGQALISQLITTNTLVYGCGKNYPKEEILQNSRFTFIDIDLSQPLPSHLSDFDLVIHLSSEKIENSLNLSTTTKNMISLAKQNKSDVIICLPITSSTDFIENSAANKNTQKILKIFLVGDIYGPGMLFGPNRDLNSYYLQNKLTNLINQATSQNKIILEKEGLEMIYPIYVDDAKNAILKFSNLKDSKKIRYIISGTPLTSLSASYEIQNAAKSILQKDTGIFFSGTENSAKLFREATISIPDIGISHKHSLSFNIAEIFESYKNANINSDKKQTDSNKQQQSPSQSIELQQSQISEKPKHLKLKKTSKLSSFKAKIIIAIILLFIVSFAKISLDVYLGTQNIKSAKSNLSKGDFILTKKKAENAQLNFKTAQGEFSFITYPISFIIPQKIQGIIQALKSANHASAAVSNFSEGAGVLSQHLAGILSTNTNSQSANTKDSSASFSKAIFEAAFAGELAKNAQNAGIFERKMQKAGEDLSFLSEVSQISYDLTNLIKVIASSDNISYLILIENNSELRPGGGFIGNYGLANFKNGKLISVDVDDIYTIDGQLKEKITPPKELTQKLGVKQLYLRDSNWTTDFQINSKTAIDFYKKETGKDVDGVIAFDLSFMQKLLEKIGPLKMEDYKEEITAQNLFEKGEYYAEVGFFPGSTQKRDFFASLAKTLITKITSSLTNPDFSASSQLPWLALIETIKENLSQKPLLLSFVDPTLSTFIKTKSWDNPLPPTNYNITDDAAETRDFIALAEANIGANKVNRYIERKINYEMTIGRDADLMATLTITYKNNSPADTWPAGTYVNFLRVYVPAPSGLEDFQFDQKSDLKKVEVSSQANLTVFSTLLEVPVKQTKTVIFKYRIPKNIKLEKAPYYSIYFQKQPGTEKDPLTFTFNLPGYLKIESINNKTENNSKQNISLGTDLAEDRRFLIKVVKK